MNSKHRKTLAAVFVDPIPATLRWAAIEALFIALECEIVEGAGSAVRFTKGRVVGYFHRPHPGKEAKRYQVRNARLFLSKLGVGP